MGERSSLSKKALVIGLVIGLIIGLGIGYKRPTDSEQKIRDLERQVTNLQQQLDSKNTQITALQSQISELQSQIEELKQLLPPIRKGAWNLIKTFSGKSGVTTDYFYVGGTELRINWTWSSSAEKYALFCIYIYEEGQLLFTEWLAFLQKRGTTYVHNVKPANYYLKISEANLDRWTVTIEVWIPK